MKVLLASGIFFPDVGGPATHVRKIAEHFSHRGWKVTVVAFGEPLTPSGEKYTIFRASRAYGKLFSWILYAFLIFREVLRHDIVYAFDLTTAGVPAALSARVFRKPLFLRIGGDPIWERVVEHGERFLPMRSYYEKGLYKEDRPFLLKMIRFVVNSARTTVTYCDFLKNIYTHYYAARNVLLIKNPFPQSTPPILEQGSFTFLFAGRFVSYKNLSRVLRVFGRIVSEHTKARLVLIGDGPEESLLQIAAGQYGASVQILSKVNQSELFSYIDASSVSIAPALTEFNPNFILETLARGKPALISKDNGLSVDLPEHFQFNPLDDESLYKAMKKMLDPIAYQEALNIVSRLSLTHTWEEVVKEHEGLVKRVILEKKA